MSLFDDIIRKVGVYNFDPSDSNVVIAGWELNDFTSVTLTPTTRTTSVQGVDVLYHDYVTIPNYYDITVSVLASCRDLDELEKLQSAFNELGGWFQIVCTQNGRFIGTFDCYFRSDSGDSITSDANDKVFEFSGVKRNDDVIESDLGAFETPVAIEG